MKKISLIITFALCAILLCACGAQTAESTEIEVLPEAKTEQESAALSSAAGLEAQSAINAHSICVLLGEAGTSASARMAVGAQEYAAFSGMSIAALGLEEDTDAARASLIREALAQKPEALCVAFEGGEETERALIEARESGVLVVACGQADIENADACILPAQDALFGAAIMDALAETMGETGSFAVFTNEAENGRAQGALSHRQEVYADMQPRGEALACGADSESAYAAIKAALENETPPDGILLTGAAAMQGAARAVDELQLKGKLHIAGAGLPGENLGLLQNGIVDAFVSSDPSLNLQAACALARLMLEGNEVGEHTDLGVVGFNDLSQVEPNVFAGGNLTIVTAENADGLGY